MTDYGSVELGRACQLTGCPFDDALDLVRRRVIFALCGADRKWRVSTAALPILQARAKALAEHRPPRPDKPALIFTFDNGPAYVEPTNAAQAARRTSTC